MDFFPDIFLIDQYIVCDSQSMCSSELGSRNNTSLLFTTSFVSDKNTMITSIMEEKEDGTAGRAVLVSGATVFI